MITSQKAIVIQGAGVAKLVADRPHPALRDNSILVRTVAVGLNPTDWKHIDGVSGPDPGRLVGCDYAGIVEGIGPDVTKAFKIGDRVFGAAHGSNVLQHEDGTFAEHIVVVGDLQMIIPDGMSFEEAATLGVGLGTVGQSLYQALELAPTARPAKTAVPVLIYGGSTATGTLSIQYAKLSGYTVVTTTSYRNFQLVRDLGADAVFDYNDSECAAKIREFTNNRLKIAFDTVSVDESANICAEALAKGSDARYHALLPVAFPRDDVKTSMSLGYTVYGQPVHVFGMEVPAKREDFDFAVKFLTDARELLAEGKLKPHPARVGQGLENVLSGLEKMKANKISGQKLVYRI
ncbi:putative zinc-binding oxidoreductase ToxD [Trichoderma barbatum]